MIKQFFSSRKSNEEHNHALPEIGIRIEDAGEKQEEETVQEKIEMYCKHLDSYFVIN